MSFQLTIVFWLKYEAVFAGNELPVIDSTLVEKLVHHNILVLYNNFGALIQGTTVAIPVVVWLLAFSVAEASFVISGFN
jgi:hypothetical protein